MTFVSKKDANIKFAVDLKTTYVDEKYPGFCNGFTLCSHGEYLEYRSLSKELYNPKAPKRNEIQWKFMYHQ